MSDARQAIAAAEQANDGKAVPDTLADAFAAGMPVFRFLATIRG